MTGSSTKKPKSKENSPTRNKSSHSGFYTYSSIAVKMIGIILAGVFAGMKLDEYFELEKPYVTFIMAIVSVVFAMYIVIKDISKAA